MMDVDAYKGINFSYRENARNLLSPNNHEIRCNTFIANDCNDDIHCIFFYVIYSKRK